MEKLKVFNQLNETGEKEVINGLIAIVKKFKYYRMSRMDDYIYTCNFIDDSALAEKFLHESIGVFKAIEIVSNSRGYKKYFGQLNLTSVSLLSMLITLIWNEIRLFFKLDLDKTIDETHIKTIEYLFNSLID